VGRRPATSAEELAASALRVVRRSGLAGVSSRAVASEAGVALGTVYRHVPDLQNLLVAAAGQVETRFVDALRAAAPQEEPLLPAVPRIAAALVDEAAREPRLAELLALPRGSGTATDGAGIRRWIADRVRAAAEAGELVAGDPEIVAAAAHGLVRGVFEHALTTGPGWAGAEDVLAVGLRGLLDPVGERATRSS
jgi:AcrR family transcriptional regulator